MRVRDTIGKLILDERFVNLSPNNVTSRERKNVKLTIEVCASIFSLLINSDVHGTPKAGNVQEIMIAFYIFLLRFGVQGEKMRNDFHLCRKNTQTRPE